MKAKPKNMKYTDLCIYIDKTVYERDEHNNPTGLRKMTEGETINVYNYLHSLIYALAIKKRLMNSKEEYDMFCLDITANIFVRLRREDQDYSGADSRNKPIKSILNYVKGTLPFMAITWKGANYFQTIKPDYHTEKEVVAVKDYAQAQVTQDYTEERAVLYQELLQTLPYYLNKGLDKSIFKRNVLERHQFLLSEYATLCNCLTLTKLYEESAPQKQEKLILNQFKNRRDYCINLTDDPFITADMIELQLRRGFFLAEDAANSIKRDTTPTDEEIHEILSSAMPTYGINQKGD